MIAFTVALFFSDKPYKKSYPFSINLIHKLNHSHPTQLSVLQNHKSLTQNVLNQYKKSIIIMYHWMFYCFSVVALTTNASMLFHHMEIDRTSNFPHRIQCFFIIDQHCCLCYCQGTKTESPRCQSACCQVDQRPSCEISQNFSTEQTIVHFTAS